VKNTVIWVVILCSSGGRGDISLELKRKPREKQGVNRAKHVSEIRPVEF
jgi:hypothetical protein